MVFRKLIFIYLIFALCGIPCKSADESQGSWFVFSQLKFPGNWDPYPEAFSQIYHYLINTTSLRIMPDRRIIEMGENRLFDSPFIVVTGRGSYPAFEEKYITDLRRYIEGGGLLFIETNADVQFRKSVERTINRVFPEKRYKKIPQEHAVFRSFYLIDFVSGLSINVPYLETIMIGSRSAVILSHNNLFGVWARDRMGNWKYPLVPGRYRQRREAIKLTLNIIMFSLCGTYKNDPVHQPAIKRKLGR